MTIPCGVACGIDIECPVFCMQRVVLIHGFELQKTGHLMEQSAFLCAWGLSSVAIYRMSGRLYATGGAHGFELQTLALKIINTFFVLKIVNTLIWPFFVAHGP